ncbi:MAG: desulfoferrodoxin [Oscillospiraceae bacterium]|nr:desulfoferrodoxin [Oscillospiraceae bacterium]
MCGNQKFYICKLCGNLIGLIVDNCPSLSCCGQKMVELVPNTVDASAEKHLPVVNVAGDSHGTVHIKIGSTLHPMTDEHNIAFVYVETERGGQRKCLKTGEEPTLFFGFVDDKPIAVYAYCNLHGLWKTEIK